jgi:hypothetical protein
MAESRGDASQTLTEFDLVSTESQRRLADLPSINGYQTNAWLSMFQRHKVVAPYEFAPRLYSSTTNNGF